MDVSEFELRRRLHAWRVDVQPARDLWSNVAARIGVQAPHVLRARRTAWPEGLAAAIVIAIGMCTLLYGHRPRLPVSPVPAGTATLIEHSYAAAMVETGGWGARPRSASIRRAQVELDGAQADLAAALAARPDAPVLLALLQRTHAQRVRLARLAARIG